MLFLLSQTASVVDTGRAWNDTLYLKHHLKLSNNAALIQIATGIILVITA